MTPTSYDMAPEWWNSVKWTPKEAQTYLAEHGLVARKPDDMVAAVSGDELWCSTPLGRQVWCALDVIRELEHEGNTHEATHGGSDD